MSTPYTAYLVGYAYPDNWFDDSPGVWIEEIIVKDRYLRSASITVPVWRYSYTNKILFVIGSGPKRLDFTHEYEAYDPQNIFLDFTEARQKAAEYFRHLQEYITKQQYKWSKLHRQWCDEQSMFRQMAETLLPLSEFYISPFTGKQE